jgi:hypothetical protein
VSTCNPGCHATREGAFTEAADFPGARSCRPRGTPGRAVRGSQEAPDDGHGPGGRSRPTAALAGAAAAPACHSGKVPRGGRRRITDPRREHCRRGCRGARGGAPQLPPKRVAPMGVCGISARVLVHFSVASAPARTPRSLRTVSPPGRFPADPKASAGPFMQRPNSPDPWPARFRQRQPVPTRGECRRGPGTFPDRRMGGPPGNRAPRRHLGPPLPASLEPEHSAPSPRTDHSVNCVTAIWGE